MADTMEAKGGGSVRLPAGKPTHKPAAGQSARSVEQLKASGWLTDAQIARLVQTPGPYRIGPRVTLRSDRPGRGSAELRFMRNGRTRWMGLGGWPEVLVAEMRHKADAAMDLLRQGIDPLEQKAADKQAAAVAAARAISFSQAAERYLAGHAAAWRNPKHRQQWQNTLATHARAIADIPVADIDAPAVLRVLTPIWTSVPETASRLRGRIEAVLDFARVQKWRDGPNPATWKGNLALVLPARSKVRAVKHHAALPWPELPEFLTRLVGGQGVAALALQFLILTAVRSGEVRGARWAEIDLAKRTWSIPPGRMKAGKEHRVPLSDAALDVLRQVAPWRRADDLVFPGMKRGAPLSDMSLTAVLRRTGRGDLTVHGFRSSFRDWVAETTHYPNHVVEQALAHTIGNQVEAAYRRGDLFSKRQELMAAWARYCSGVAGAGA
jgi:integrase